MGEKGIIGVPTMGGMGSAFKDFGVGLIGGIAFLLAYQVFGGLGLIAAPLIAGSMIKGDRGKMISTMAGFMICALGALNMGGGGNGQDSGDM